MADMSSTAVQVPVRVAALGYLHAVGRLDEKHAMTPTWPPADEAIFIPLIECLTWLDMLLDHPAVRPLVDPDLRLALKFARGRSHHAWAQAIEYRDDVLLETRMAGASSSAIVGPIVVADWCWRQPEQIAGGKRPGRSEGKDEFKRLLAGKQSRSVLHEFIAVINDAGLIL
jgi:hypothetical protein